jgi:hypothetical protein
VHAEAEVVHGSGRSGVAQRAPVVARD